MRRGLRQTGHVAACACPTQNREMVRCIKHERNTLRKKGEEGKSKYREENLSGTKHSCNFGVLDACLILCNNSAR